MIHRTARSAALFLGAAAAALSLTAARAQDAEQIFNGKNLDGWEGNPKLWSVQDGVLVGETADSGDKKIKGNTFLIWKGGDVVNFELTATARCVGNNSGIQYRSKVVDPDNWVVAGYQMDMHPNQPYVGMLYDEKGRGIACLRGQKVVLENGQKPKVTGELPVEEVDLSKWNDFKIVAKGNTVEHYVNGKLAAVIVDNDEKERELSGILALQVHAGPAMKVEFKSVALRKLPGDAPAPKAEAEKPAAKKKQANTKARRGGAKAQWIWAAENSPDNETVYFRKAFDFDGPKQAAILQVSCDNHYEIALNGKAIGKGDAWESPGSYDVRAQLVPGKNVIAVKARNDSGIAALAVALNIDAGKGRPAPSVVSDASWKWSRETADGWATAAFDDSKWSEPFVHGAMGRAPWNDVFSTALAQGGIQDVSEELNALPGFRIEKLYHVPKGQQGSWVSLTADPQGRLYASDQGGKICRITPPPVDADEDAEPVVEPLDLEIGHAHGLLWAFDSLYVSVNGGRGSGLYRVTDKNGDGELDDVALLRKMDGGGEHGPHAVVLSPDGRSLYVAGGNHTKIPAPEESRPPRVWDEDQVLTRMPDARGHANGVMAPGGWICKTDPEGKTWELFCNGFRNEYDFAFNGDGEIFTDDSDMEWDTGMPWYRPTRINHATSGAEFGWRHGSGKMPAYYADTLPSIVDVGPGSPTGVVSGAGAKFPAKYQRAIYAMDWTYGTMYALHLKPSGSTYEAEKEEFLSGVPLNLSDMVVGPKDGALYFAVGGRNTQSALYRVIYEGDESTAPADLANKDGADLRALRHSLEAFHGKEDKSAVETAWPQLGHEDRNIRFAARIAVEWQPVATWQDKALAETNPRAAIEALIALARHGDKALAPKVYAALEKVGFGDLDEMGQLALIRAYGLATIRLGKPDAATASAIAERFAPFYPNASPRLNRELCSLFVAIGDPGVVAKTVPMMALEVAADAPRYNEALLKRNQGYGSAFGSVNESNPQGQQIHYAYALREATAGWTPALRKEFFGWFPRARNFKGGASFDGFIENIRKESLAKVPDAERGELDKLSQAPAPKAQDLTGARIINIGAKAGLLFDVTEVEAKAGEDVAIIFKNNDPSGLMHNLAIAKPGSLAQVIKDAIALGADGPARHFIPDTGDILHATPIVVPNASFTLRFNAPDQPGDYVIVCTYPGHGQLMNAVLRVK